jgi:hypothetical protein
LGTPDPATSSNRLRLTLPNGLRQFGFTIGFNEIEHDLAGAAGVDPLAMKIEADIMIVKNAEKFQQVRHRLARQITSMSISVE